MQTAWHKYERIAHFYIYIISTNTYMHTHIFIRQLFAWKDKLCKYVHEKVTLTAKIEAIKLIVAEIEISLFIAYFPRR